MARGRKPLPPTLRLLRGHARKRGSVAGVSLPTAEPEPPAWLTGAALDVWHYYAPQLASAGVLTLADRDTLATFCVHAQIVGECREAIAADGLLTETPGGHRQTSPHYSILHRSTRLMAALASDLGLNPASRTRVRATHTDDKLTDFLRTERKA